MESWWDLRWLPQINGWKTWDKLKDLMFECPVIPTLDKDMLLHLDYLKPFVKRLVNNDKIDFSRGWEYCIKSIEEFDWLLRDDENWLIMLLAISNSPLEFLCKILK
jgi:hypothetical protein